MTQPLNLHVRLLSDRYHGEEWPPSPARLAQALLAGAWHAHRGVPQLPPAQQFALSWMEATAPDAIDFARVMPRGQRYRLAVPNNDGDRIPDHRDRLALKDVLQWRHRTPGRRLWVRYQWRGPAIEDEARAGLSELAETLYRLGCGQDFAFACRDTVADEEGESLTRSALGAKRISVPAIGFIDELSRIYASNGKRSDDSKIFRMAERPKAITSARYAPTDNASMHEALQFELFDSGNERRLRHDAHRGIEIAAWLRHAVAECLTQAGFAKSWIDRCVLGHDQPSHSERFSFVPVPSYTGPHPDGLIRRCLVMVPASTPNFDSVLGEMSFRLHGWSLIDDREAVRAQMQRAEGHDTVFDALARTSNTFETLTPMLLHGHVTKGRGRGANVGRFSQTHAERLFEQAWLKSSRRARIHSVEFSPFPFRPGAKSAAEYWLPTHLQRFPRMHVRACFEQTLTGPLLLGIGQHYGVGLFAPS